MKFSLILFTFTILSYSIQAQTHFVGTYYALEKKHPYYTDIVLHDDSTWTISYMFRPNKNYIDTLEERQMTETLDGIWTVKKRKILFYRNSNYLDVKPAFKCKIRRNGNGITLIPTGSIVCPKRLRMRRTWEAKE